LEAEKDEALHAKSEAVKEEEESKAAFTVSPKEQQADEVPVVAEKVETEKKESVEKEKEKVLDKIKVAEVEHSSSKPPPLVVLIKKPVGKRPVKRRKLEIIKMKESIEGSSSKKNVDARQSAKRRRREVQSPHVKKSVRDKRSKGEVQMAERPAARKSVDSRQSSKRRREENRIVESTKKRTKVEIQKDKKSKEKEEQVFREGSRMKLKEEPAAGGGGGAAATKLMDIWKALWSHRYADPFKFPVDKEDAPEYDDVIKRRMDLHEIKMKLENRVFVFLCFAFGGLGGLITTQQQKQSTQ